MELLLILSSILTLLVLILVIVFRPRPNNNLFALSNRLDQLFSSLDKLSDNLKQDFRTNREESAAQARDNRSELSETLRQFKQEMSATLQAITQQSARSSEAVNKTLEEKISALIYKVEEANRINRETTTANLKDFSAVQQQQFSEWKNEQKEVHAKTIDQLEKITARVEEKLTGVNEQAKTDGHLMRQTLETSFKGFRETFQQSVHEINNLQREKFGQLEAKQADLIFKTEEKLERMRETVDEKLQKTLNERLGHSFELVGKQLERVQQGLGEMHSLAQDVGGLKRVLSNVKMRGSFGEVQLQMLLENILAPDQYEANVATKRGSADRVEFAIKLPNPDGERAWVWLPVDAKFPREAYEQLQTAYDMGDALLVEAAQKALELAIKKMARDICEKYIDPPATTGFAVLFLPFEGIYAEVVRKATLLEEIQRECHIMVAGPATLWAYLHSLQMGFRTLAIQKRTSEVWSVLGEVKKEFRNFGGLLQKAQKNLHTASHTLDEVMGKRTRAIERKLRDVEVLEDDDNTGLLHGELPKPSENDALA